MISRQGGLGGEGDGGGEGNGGGGDGGGGGGEGEGGGGGGEGEGDGGGGEGEGDGSGPTPQVPAQQALKLTATILNVILAKLRGRVVQPQPLWAEDAELSAAAAAAAPPEQVASAPFPHPVSHTIFTTIGVPAIISAFAPSCKSIEL